MIRRFAILIPLLCPLATADSPPQTQVIFTTGPSGSWAADWTGVVGRSYFMQYSFDLINWSYLPVIRFGNGPQYKDGNTTNAPKFFIRLRYVDDTTATTLQQARDADFDNDGIPNSYEVETLGTDPLDKASAGGDSDYDGLADGWEKYFFGGLSVANPNAILMPDGLTNKEKAELGLSPLTDYSATLASQPAKFAYDLTGRLTSVTSPVGGGAYTPDEERNLTNSQ